MQIVLMKKKRLSWKFTLSGKSNFIALATTLALSALVQAPVYCWDKAPIKSYDIEHQVYRLCQQSDALINSSRYNEAINLLKQAASFDETSYSAYAHENAANCYRGLKQYPQAVKECQTALKFDPEFSSAIYTLALIYYDQEHFDTAAQYLKKLLRVTRDQQWIRSAQDLLVQIDTYGRISLALKEIDKGHMESARQQLLEAAKHDPSRVSADVHADLAYVLRQTGKPEQAIEECKKSLQFEANDKDVMYSLAIAYQDIGKFKDAIACLQKYLQIETDPKQRNQAQELINDLKQDASRINDSVNSLPDYLDHMVGGTSLKRWSVRSLPIKVHIADGKGVEGFQPHYPSHIKRAFDTWSNASGNKLSYVIVGDSAKSDIDVVWISKPVVLNDGGRNRNKQGVAHVSAENEMIENVRVEIDTMNGFDLDKPLEDSECASVCMHEIGHSLGLDHSTNYADIMYFGASAKQSGMPTSRDRATIARLYANYPVSKMAPPQAKPEPIKYLPPPGFLPPKPPSMEDLRPPEFLPPPIVDDSEKLSPPFFQPLPIQPEDKQADTKKSPAPPVFLPPPAFSSKQPANSKVNSSKKSEKNTNESNPGVPFFTPPPPK